MNLKSIFLAFVMFVELIQKISEWRLVEKKHMPTLKLTKIMILKKLGFRCVFHYFTPI